jgi:imidazolonepropionase-like amidohydrolase
MRRASESSTSELLFATLLAAAVVAGAGIAPAVAAADVAVKGETVYTMAGAPIKNGVVIVKDGKIAAVGTASSVTVPSGMRVLTAKVVTPGLIDAHTVVGLSGYLNQPQDQDQIERSAPIQPELRAIDAYDARERLIDWVRGFGVTTIHTGHAPGELISGQTMIAKTRGDTVEEAVLVPSAMVAVTVGEGALVERGDAKRKSPGTRSKVIAMLRADLIKAQEYQRKLEKSDEEKRPGRDLHLETLVRVLKGEMPLMVTANRHNDILSALRVRKEFGVPMVLDGAAEAYLVVDAIKEAGVPVIVHPTMARASGDRENLSMDTAATLIHAGIPVAFQSGYESYVPKTRVVLFEAALAAARGLKFDEALAALTINAAKIIGLSARVGSIETGKDGDVALYDGDPFEYLTHCTAVVIDGQVMSEEAR